MLASFDECPEASARRGDEALEPGNLRTAVAQARRRDHRLRHIVVFDRLVPGESRLVVGLGRAGERGEATLERAERRAGRRAGPPRDDGGDERCGRSAGCLPRRPCVGEGRVEELPFECGWRHGDETGPTRSLGVNVAGAASEDGHPGVAGLSDRE